MSRARGRRRVSRLPALGRRGEGWVVGQVVLIALVLLSALLGHSWSGAYAVAAYTAGATLCSLGVVLLLSAGLQLGGSLTPFPAPRPGRQLTASGPYALARHPMYGGGILFALGWTIIFASFVGLALTFLLALFLDLKASREEIWLDERSDEYQEYRRRTPRKLVPFIY